jgi:hypothetical protein
MVFRRSSYLIEDPSLWYVSRNNFMNALAPTLFKAQPIILRSMVRPSKWIKLLKIWCELVSWMTVRNGINIFLSLSFCITIVIKKVSRSHFSKHSMDGPIAHHWADLNLVKELFLAPTSWQKLKRRWDKSELTYWLLNPIKRATPTRDVVPWSLKLVTIYTFKSLRWKVYVILGSKGSLPLPTLVCILFLRSMSSSVSSGATIKIVQCAQRIPCVPTQKMSKTPDGCGNWRQHSTGTRLDLTVLSDQGIGPTRSSHTQEDHPVL